MSILALGTAQLGMPYGIANDAGEMTDERAVKLLHHAIQQGLEWIDTAAAYGKSEQRIGLALQKNNASITLATKLSPDAHDAASTKQSIEHSLRQLQVKHVDIAMLHRFEHYNNAEIWNTLLSYKQQGIIKKLGASVQSRDEAESAMNDTDIEVIQLPCNALDWRWHNFKKQRNNLHVQVRSALLQGVLTLPPEQWPDVIDNNVAHKLHTQLHHFADEYTHGSIPALAYAYVRTLDWVDSIVIGMETTQQIDENIKLFNTPALWPEAVDAIQKAFADVSETLLNPALW